MRRALTVPMLGMLVSILAAGNALSAQGEIKLPRPALQGKMSVEQAITGRKSSRDFKAAPLSLGEVGQLLWAANGMIPADAVTGATRKVMPSAGGLYPLEVFILTGNNTVENVPAGVYQYNPNAHSLKEVATGDKRTLLAHAALGQMWLARAPAVVVIGAVFARTTAKYGNRGVNYVFMEAGNSDQNLCLQAEALGLRTGTVGAFNDAQVAGAIQMPGDTAPLLVIGVGK
ncbi:MAG: SagB/ThcOx family dehydrogenase [Desulfomonile sp.]|nr:SagB/ThcOx family dehydrogenase [Desulfomonile sp.]